MGRCLTRLWAQNEGMQPKCRALVEVAVPQVPGAAPHPVCQRAFEDLLLSEVRQPRFQHVFFF